jgi:hypothetical protein
MAGFVDLKPAAGSGAVAGVVGVERLILGKLPEFCCVVSKQVVYEEGAVSG